MTIVYIDGQNFLYKASEILILAGKIQDKQDLNRIANRQLFENMFPTEDSLESVLTGSEIS